jgi:TP901 family phage tail tape measure protein
MSDDQLGLSFTIGGDVAPLAQALQQAEQAANATSAAIDQVNQKMADGAKAALPAFIQAQVEARKIAEAEEDAAKAAQHLAAEAAHAGQALGAAGQVGAAGMGNVASETKQAEGAMMGLKEAAAGLNSAIAAVGLGAAFHGLASGIEEALTAFGSFESNLNRVRAVTGGSSDDMKALQAEAIKMGQVTAFSANEAADAMVRLAKDGFSTHEIIAALPGVLGLAAAATTSVDEAARVGAGTLRSFGLAATDMGKVADILAKAVNSSGMSLTDFGTTVKYLGPVASASGQSLLDMSTEVALMGKNMIQGSQAGTALRTLLVNLAAPSKQAGEALQALKISIVDTHGAMLPVPMIIDQIRTKTQGMANAQKEAAVEHIAGKNALSGIMALVNAAPDAYDKMRAKLDEDGAAAKIAATQLEGLNGAIKLATSSVETATKVFGEELAPAAIVVANAIQAAADSVSSLPPEVLEAAAGIAVAITAFLGMAATAAAMGAVLAGVGITAAAFSTGVGELALILGGVAIALGLTTTALADNKGAQDDTAESVNAHRQEVKELADEYETLRAKTHPSTEEQGRMHDILKKLADIAPEVVTGYNNIGDATDIDRAAADRYNSSLLVQIGLLQAISKSKADVARTEIESSKHDLDTAIKQGQDLDKRIQAQSKRNEVQIDGAAGGAAISGGGQESLDALRREQVANRRLVGELQKTYQGQNDDFQEKNGASGGSDFGTPPKLGAAYVRPAGKGHHGKGHHAPKPKSTAGHDASDIKTEEGHFKAEADAEAKAEEAANTVKLASDKDYIQQKIQILEVGKQSGLVSEQQYLEGVRALKSQEIDIVAADTQKKLEVQASALFEEYANESAAADKLRALGTQQGKDGAAAEDSKAAVSLSKLQAVNSQMQGVENKRGADQAKLTNDTTRLEEAADQRRIDSDNKAAQALQKSQQDTAAIAAQTAADQMGHYDKLGAQAEIAYTKAKNAALDAYQQTVEKINKAPSFTPAQQAKTTTELTAAVNAYTVATAAATEKHKAAAQAIQQDLIGSLTNLKTTVQDFVNNPSLDRIGSLIEKIGQNPHQIDEWGSALKKAGSDISNIPGSLQKIATDGLSATGAITSLAGGLGAIAGGVGIVISLATAFMQFASWADKGQQIRDTLQGIDTDLRVIQSDAKAGIISPADADQANIDAIKKGLADIKKQRDEIVAGPQGWLGNLEQWFADGWNGFVANQQGNHAPTRQEHIDQATTAHDDQQKQLNRASYTQIIDTTQASVNDANTKASQGLDLNPSQTKADVFKNEILALDALKASTNLDPAMLEQVKTALADAVANYKDMSEAAKVTAAATAEAAKSMVDIPTAIATATSEFAKQQQIVDTATAAIVAAREKIAAINDEIATGGRDHQGNHVSLEAEQQIKLADTRLQYEQKISDLRQKEVDLTLKISDIEKQRKLDVLAVEDKDIAIRAKSEFQVKTAEIAKINEVAAANTVTAKKDLVKTQREIVTATTDEADALATINNATRDHLTDLGKQYNAQQAIVGQQQAAITAASQLRDVYAQQLAFIVAMAAQGHSTVSVGAVNNSSASLVAQSLTQLYPAGAASSGASSGGVSYGFSGGEVGNPAALRRYADGLEMGPVPADGPIYAHKGEWVLNAAQQSNLISMLTRGPVLPASQDLVAATRASSGGGGNSSVVFSGPITIAVPPGTTQQQAQGLFDALALQVRQRGGLRT